MTELQRTSLSVQRERALLVAVILPQSDWDPRDPLGELAALATTAGAAVVDRLIQKRTRINNRTYLGKGKVEELRNRADVSEATTIIFDNDLAPAQIRELEQATDRKIVDRSELILDIFAARARTHEARLQVELAQLQYTAPRLRGMWSHLERIAGAGGGTGVGTVGGIGTRGPGERQIEIDRRIVRDRVAMLRRELARIDQRKVREVRSRADQFTVSLIGYTNSGKSTLLNALTGTKVRARDVLFDTLDTKTARWNLGDGKTVLLSDTIGFVRDLPHHLVASFKATLEETVHADLLLHVVDVSRPDAWRQLEAVNRVLDDLGCRERPTITLLNKMDITEDPTAVAVVENRLQRTLRISACTGVGLDELVRAVAGFLESRAVDVTVRLPSADGRLLADLEKHARIGARRYHGDTVEVDLCIDQTRLNQLRRRHTGLQVVPAAGRDDHQRRDAAPT